MPCWILVLALLCLGLIGGCGQTAVDDPATLAACQATLVIDVTPVGAVVTVDGAMQGQSPLRLTLDPGVVSVQVEFEGFASFRRSVRLSCDQETLIQADLQDVRPPQVWLSVPSGQVLPDEGLKVDVTAADSAGIARLALFVDGLLVAEVDEPELRYNIDTRSLPPGVHQLEAHAWDRSGLTGLARAAFVVVEPTPTPTATATATPTPTMTPTVEDETAPAAALTPAAQQSETPTPFASVAVSRRNIDIPTYGYRQTLYTDPARAGHPYPLLGEGWGTVSSQTYELIVLRNDYLEVELMPELGGRIYQLRYLPTGQSLLYNNRVIKPTKWGPPDQGWWLAVGGIEFCLPVDEHGYVTAEPWSASVAELDDGSATVTLRLVEQTRQVAVEVTVTLHPGLASVDIGSRLTSQSDKAESLQYWLNAMISPGKQGVGSGLRFVMPGDQALLHSTGQQGMPAEYETFSWPTFNGRDLSRYSNWDGWLGFFMPTRSADFAAVYDDDADIGLVRVFPGGVASGLKLFGFGSRFDAGIYTDDGSQYVELWGGLTRTFQDETTLAPGASVFWRETWYPIADMSGPSMANAQIALWAVRSSDRLIVQAHGTSAQQVVLVVMQGGAEISRQPVSISPTRPLRLELGLRGNLSEETRVLILRPTGEVIIEQTVASLEG